MKRLLLWLCLILPVLFWGALHLHHQIWWVENIISAPGVFLAYYMMVTIAATLARQWLLMVTGCLVCLAFFLMTPTHQRIILANCTNPISIAQFNLYYDNPDVNALMNVLIHTPSDLVVLQEVSPEVGRKLLSLDDLYPYQIGGQENLGFPSSQLILSRLPLSNIEVLTMPDGLKVTKSVWHPVPQKKLMLFTAHPPSPRDEQLWNRRNAMIHTLEILADQQGEMDYLVVGDFNLSSASLRYAKLFSGAESAPVASWPNQVAGIPMPSFAMVAIDHLWLHSLSGRRICERSAHHQPEGSDHRLVATRIGY